MAKHRTPVQFRLEEEIFNILKREADARALTPNEYAKKLMNQTLLSDVKATERNSTNIRLNATGTFVLLAAIPLLIRLIEEGATAEESMAMAEKEIFSLARQKTENLMRTLGIED